MALLASVLEVAILGLLCIHVEESLLAEFSEDESDSDRWL